MTGTGTRRRFLRASAAAGALALPFGRPAGARTEVDHRRAGDPDGPIRVVVWDEQQPAQKQAYDHFLGNRIAEHLRSQAGLEVTSVRLDDPQQGLPDEVLDGCRVLIWWGHVRQAEVAPEVGRKIVARINAGDLSLVALHSAHWSTPFVEAMNERARSDVRARLREAGREDVEVRFIPPQQRYTVPRADARVTPYQTERKFPDGRIQLTVHLPICCFPAYRTDGKPSQVRVLQPGHPIVAGLPRTFELPHTEMYDEPFHVPEPDEVLLEERWADGSWFRSGMVWTLGKGRVFYFRPGHETFPIFENPHVLAILTNAVRWLGARE